MAVLRLSLLGPFTAAHNDTPLNYFQTNKVKALLIYLAGYVWRFEVRPPLSPAGVPWRVAASGLS